jgi:hypothetical protein
MFAKVILLLLLSATIVYFNKVPLHIGKFANSIPGRLVLFGSVLALYNSAGWMSAMLMTLIGLLLIAGGSSVEGFMGNAFPSKLRTGSTHSEGFAGYATSSKLRTGTTQSEGFAGENFSSDINIIEKKPGSKWWDEVLLGRESIVKTNLVETQPVQG